MQRRDVLRVPAALVSALRGREAEAELERLLDQLSIGLYRATTSGQLLEANGVLRRLFGLGADEDITKYNLYDFLVLPREARGGERASEVGEVLEREVQVRRRDGVVIWLNLIETLHADTQEGSQVEGLAQEVTERRHAEEALWLGEEYFRMLVEHASDVVYVLSAEGVIRYLSPSVQQVLGYRADELIGTDALLLVHPKERENARSWLEKNLADPGFHGRLLMRLRHKDGHWRQVEACTENLLENPVVGGVVVSARDVTRRGAELRHRGSAGRLRRALQTAGVGVWELAVRTGRMRGSRSMSALFGTESTWPARHYGEFLKRIHPADVEQVTRAVERAVDEKSDLEIEFRVVWRDGSTHWLSARGRVLNDREGRVARILGIATDITERKHLEDKLLHEAFHDSLTGLPNRAIFLDRLHHTSNIAERRPGHAFAVLIVDLDHFKRANDTYGHLVGDQLLVAVARRLERCLRPGDTVTRFGGDEFTVLIEDIHAAGDATRVAERILRELSGPFRIGAHEVRTGCSIGLALSSTGYTQPEDVLRNADIALYRAKVRGRSGYEIFDRVMHQEALQLLRLEGDLQHALKRREMSLAFQPIVSLASGGIAGFEALLRWTLAGRGPIAPTEFIPVAEECGTILELDRWVIGEACRQLQSWCSAGAGVQLSINLSGRAVGCPELVERIREMLRDAGCEAGALGVEFSERALGTDPDAASEMLQQLRAMGVQIRIDNFGIGHAGLGALHRLPIDALKIDRALIGRIDTDPASRNVAAALVTFAQNLGHTVIAEGVETAEQLAALRQMGCDLAQGFYFAQPMPAEEAHALLVEGRSW